MTTIITKLIFLFVSFFKSRKFLLIGLVLLTAVIGIITDRFLGGVVAWIIDSLQFITLVVYIFLVLVYYLFKGNVFENTKPIPRGNLQLFVLLIAVAGYCIVFTVLNITHKP
jgi:phosphoglycerol transferase MdoB-like AlkP superfamily enzyme